MAKEPRPRWQWLLLGLLGLLILAYAGASWFFSNVLIAFPTYSLEEDRNRLGISSPADFGLPQPQDFTVNTANVQLSGWFFQGTNRCGVLFLHGIGSSRYTMLKYAPMFWQRGCSLMFYDARRHGSSTGKYGTYGYYESKDAVVMLSQFKALTALNDNQLGMLGESYGAASAILAAQNVPNLAFVIADSSYESLKAIVYEQGEKQYGKLIKVFIPGAFLLSELRARFDVSKVSPLDSVERVRVPLLLQHALEDDYTPAEHSKHLFANSDKSQTMLYLSDWGAGHAEAINTNPQAYTRVVDEFLAAYAPEFQ
ncbi:MAG: alpha/beta hydrolase [Trueperaceae bacterium]|nr:alpha/beta hydrolase [Trueperaceae bacterium]